MFGVHVYFGWCDVFCVFSSFGCVSVCCVYTLQGTQDAINGSVCCLWSFICHSTVVSNEWRMKWRHKIRWACICTPKEQQHLKIQLQQESVSWSKIIVLTNYLWVYIRFSAIKNLPLLYLVNINVFCRGSSNILVHNQILSALDLWHLGQQLFTWILLLLWNGAKEQIAVLCV